MKRLVIAACLALALAGCDSARERAQQHYDSAVALLAQGDADRALVELRNVLKLDGEHREGRLLMARLLHERGDLRGAYAQYLKLVEQYPDDAEGLKALAALAYEAGDLAETRLRVDAALAALPGDSGLKAIAAATAYAEARQKGDSAAAAAAVAAARALVAADPALLPARLAVISDDLAAGNAARALDLAEAGIAIDDKPRQLHVARLAALEMLGDKAGIEAELRRMTALYPADPSIGATLVRWYVTEGRLDDAEAWLRGLIRPDGTDPDPRLTLVRFLFELRSPEAALAEIDRILAASPPPPDVAGNLAQFRALQAGFLFATGERDRALSEMQELLAGAEPSEQTNRLKIGLAQMRVQTGDKVGARALVEEVLAADPANVAALKLKAGWLIDDDLTDDAVAALREALNVAPRDPEALTLLARAYERQGNPLLVGQMLQQAVEAANAAPEESLRYAAWLLQDGKYPAAEDVVIAALRLASADVKLLAMLAQVHLAMRDWSRTGADIARLREIATPEAVAAADEIQARLLAGQGDTDALTAFLESLAASDKAGIGPEVAVIRARLAAGQTGQAIERARALLAAHSDLPAVKFVLAAILARDAATAAEAESLLREVVAAQPQAEQAWMELYGLRTRAGDAAGAAEVLEAALRALPGSTNLQWLRAGVLERRGDIEGAIAIYEAIYARNSDSPVIANNLASLIASTRDDPASLERAWAVARRLKDTKVPAFADTYGWISFLRGDAAGALPYLQLAAEGMPEDPTIHYHLGRVLAELKQTEAARAAFAEARRRITPETPGLPGLSGQIDRAEAALDGG